LLFLLVIAGLGAYLFFGGGFEQLATPTSDSSAPPVAEPVDVTVQDLLDRAVDNGDGTMTVTVTEAETGGLVRDALEGGGTATLRDVTTDLVRPDGDAPGQMRIAGRLRDRDVPVTAVVDLAPRDGRVDATVRSVGLGPLPVPGSLREDLNQQLREVSLLGDQEVAVEELHTTDRELVATGRRR
jgi:hypothetical protein